MAAESITLGMHTRIRLEERDCLPLRSKFGQCRACQSVCPTGALRVSLEAVALEGHCTGCGRCAASCPTGALHAPGFDVPPARMRTEPVESFECSRVPAMRRVSGATVVPCLGGLSAAFLAERCAAGDGVVIVDRGWCDACPAGGAKDPPWQGAVGIAALWLEAAGAVPEARPRVVAMPFPPAWIETGEITLPVPVEEMPDPSRRAFLRVALPKAEAPTASPMGSSGRAAHPASARRESSERRRLLNALDRVAAARGTSTPAEFFPRLTDNGACADHRVCVAACPTGALKASDAGGRATLEHSPEACIACRACERACPEGALALDPRGGGREPRVVAAHRVAACPTCGETFAPRGDETECSTCRKSGRFMSDAMSRLFGSPPRT